MKDSRSVVFFSDLGSLHCLWADTFPSRCLLSSLFIFVQVNWPFSLPLRFFPLSLTLNNLTMIYLCVVFFVYCALGLISFFLIDGLMFSSNLEKSGHASLNFSPLVGAPTVCMFGHLKLSHATVMLCSYFWAISPFLCLISSIAVFYLIYCCVFKFTNSFFHNVY